MPVHLAAPSAADVARIAADPDPVLRNLRITQAYHELALAARAPLGPGANWCAFATWASRQAGRTIRGEDLRAALRERLCASEPLQRLGAAARAALPGADMLQGITALVEAVLRALDAESAFARASAAVAAGNRKVFEEIGAHMARFLDALPVDEPVAFARFLAPLRPGEPPDGQQRLRDAFAAYRAALSAPDAAERAQLLFHGNLLIGLHEQVRLQPEILAALNCAFDADAVRRRLVVRLVPGFWRGLRYRIAAVLRLRPPLDEVVDRLLAVVQRELREVITVNAMTLELPGVTVRLGQDVAGPYAASLAHLDEPRLAALLDSIDPAPDTTAGSRARDWGALPQRLHHIAELFRCRHDWEPLFEPPYDPAQVEALRAGRLPAPPL